VAHEDVAVGVQHVLDLYVSEAVTGVRPVGVMKRHRISDSERVDNSQLIVDDLPVLQVL
jgi:hypothetical protein